MGRKGSGVCPSYCTSPTNKRRVDGSTTSTSSTNTGVDMNLQLPIETVNQVLGYLGTRPYQEVFQLIQAIQEAAKPKEAEPKDE